MTQHFYKRQKQTIKKLWIDQWLRHGGVWTRPQAKAVYDGLCKGNPYYTSMTIQTLLRDNGSCLGVTKIESQGHQVQVWVKN
jgi:hypothetical protein